MRSQLPLKLNSAAMRLFTSQPTVRAAQRPLAPSNKPQPLSYAPHTPRDQLEDHHYTDSLSPANPYGGAGSGASPPPGYKSAARRITLAMVAAPIAIVTSYELYQRLVLGQEQKKLGRPDEPVALGVVGTVADKSAAPTGPQG